MTDRIPDVVICERARSLANEAMFTVALQHRRLRTTEPEDEHFIFRWWADLQFLIVALQRLRRIAGIPQDISSVSAGIDDAIKTFDSALPGLRVMRNIGEHIDAYAIDSAKRHNKKINRYQLQVGSWDGTTYNWLGQELNIDEALGAAEHLFQAIKDACKRISP